MSAANKVLIRRLFEDCLNPHEASIYPEVYGNVVYRAPALGELRNELHRQFLLGFFAAFPDGRWHIEDQIAEDDKVVVRWTFIGTHRGTFMDLMPSRKQWTGSGISIYRIRDGKIVEEWQEWDTLGTMQQLAVLGSEATVWDLVAP